MLTGTLGELATLAAQAASPSLIVIGEVVALREQLAWFDKQNAAQGDALAGTNLKLVSLA
ncbi:Siroheme synthase [compost metagenome]